MFIQDEYTHKAIKQVSLGRSFFITGKAGTGKTTLLKEIVKDCRALRKNIAVATPTGVAAKNAEGQTLHSLFGLKTIIFIPGKTRKWNSTWKMYKYQWDKQTKSIIPVVYASFTQFPSADGVTACHLDTLSMV